MSILISTCPSIHQFISTDTFTVADSDSDSDSDMDTDTIAFQVSYIRNKCQKSHNTPKELKSKCIQNVAKEIKIT